MSAENYLYHYHRLDAYFRLIPPQKIAGLLEEYLYLALQHPEPPFRFGTTSELVFHTLTLRNILEDLQLQA